MPMDPKVTLSQLADPVRRRLFRALAHRALFWESGNAVVDWAGEALAAGWDSKPLAILAGLDKPPNEFETDRYLGETLTSLGVAWPHKDELMRVLSVIIAGDIVAGETTARAGCAELTRLCIVTGYLPPLMEFWAAEDELDLADRGVYGTVEDVSRHIVEAARRLLAYAPP
jgi:hypothetical protein